MNDITCSFALVFAFPLLLVGCNESNNLANVTNNGDAQFEMILNVVDSVIGKRFQYVRMEEMTMASYQFDGSIDKVVIAVDPLLKEAGYMSPSNEMGADSNKTYKNKNGTLISISRMDVSVKKLDMKMLIVQKIDSGTKSETASQVSKLPPETKRFYDLSDLAKSAFSSGEKQEAREYAEELLSLAPQHKGDWNYGNAIHDGNLILGRIAVMENRLEDAKKLLIEAGKSPGSPQMNSFGPNMHLAKDLLERGEQEIVLEYFDLCRNFWDMGYDKLDTWTKDVKSGSTPDFGANLLY